MRRLILLLTLLLVPSITLAQVPRIFFTDLISGPNTNGESVSGFSGAYVTIYGSNFGSSQGASTITWNGINCLRVVPSVGSYTGWGSTYLWYQKIIVQLGSSCTPGTGNFIITTPTGTSNGVSFTVNSTNHIFCVSLTGNDTNTGTFPSSCWAGYYKAANTITPGDVAYFENGTSLTGVSNFNADLWLGDSGSGTAGNLKALVAYPGATATVGTITDQPYAIRGSDFHGSNNYWLIAGLVLRAQSQSIDWGSTGAGSLTGWRVIANDMSCPNGSAATACTHVGPADTIAYYGNNVHNVGDTAGVIEKLYHGVYFTTNSNHVDVGWNLIDNNPNGSTTSGGCRGLQFNSTGGADQFDLHVHDNIIRNTICDGINFATVNPDLGTVEAYNNLIYHSGTGPDPTAAGETSSHYSCFNTGAFNSHTNPVLIYNNTMYDCGARAGSAGVGAKDAGGIDPGVATSYTNNIMFALSTSSEPYLNQNANPANLSGSNNLWFGAGNGPTQTTTNVNSNPLLINPPSNLQIQSNSPALGSGTSSRVPVTDFNGIIRPASPAIGALQPSVPTLVSSSACPNSATSGTPNWPTTPPFQYQCNLAEPTMAGNTLIVAFGTSGVGPYTVIDQKGDTFTLDITSPSSNGRTLLMFRATNIAAGNTWISVQEGTRDNNWQPVVFEVSNSATLDTSSCNTGSSTSITSGLITPTVIGDLILQATYSPNYNSPPGTNSSFTAGSQSNITWALAHALVGDGSASQWGVYNSTSSINPTFTSGTSATFISCSVALKQQIAGGSQTAFHVYHQEHDNMPKNAPNPWHVGVPVDVAGALYMAYVGNDQISSVSSSPSPTGTAWTASGSDFSGLNGHNHVNIYCASWISPPGYVDVSITRGGNTQDSVNMMYVVANGTCTLDADSGGQAANQTSIVSSLPVCTNCLTPTLQNDIIISEGGQANCTGTSLITPSSSAFFTAGWYSGNTVDGPSQTDENNMWAIIRNGASLSPISVTIGETCGTSAQANWANRVAAYKTTAIASSPTVSLSPTSLGYGNQPLHITSSAQSTTLTNTGSASLTIISITLTGTNPSDFSISSNTCGSSLPVNGTCTVSVTFTPNAVGSRSANLTFTTNASTSPDNVTLTGTGIAPVASFSPTSLTFGGIKVGLSSLAQSVTLTNTGNAVMSITSIGLTGANAADYLLATTCVASLAINANCAINITFTPIAIGTRVASISVVSNTATSPDTVPITGVGFFPITGIGTISGVGTVKVQP